MYAKFQLSVPFDDRDTRPRFTVGAHYNSLLLSEREERTDGETIAMHNATDLYADTGLTALSGPPLLVWRCGVAVSGRINKVILRRARLALGWVTVFCG